MLDAATAEALRNSDVSDRKLIRKSDTLATFCKTLLKVESAIVTLVKVLIQSGSSLHLAATCSFVLLGVQGITTFRYFTRFAEKLLKYKSERDEASEQIAPGAEEKARLYTASLQMRELSRTLWKLSTCSLVVLAWYLQGATRENIAIYVRLALQVSSADDNFQKMSQTSPKFKRILRVFSDGGGLWKYLVRACTATKKRMHRHDPDVENACDVKTTGIR